MEKTLNFKTQTALTPRTIIKCKKCGDIIYSKKDGDWTSCSCGACFIDQNASYYTRIGGNKEDWEVVKDGM